MTDAYAAWLERATPTARELAARWSLTLEAPFSGPEVSCAWVAAGARADGTPVVLKLGMPHMEARDEIRALRFWNGDATVRLLDADESLNAMLLERCEPGTHLRQSPEPEQDVVLAGLLRRLWRKPPPGVFRPLREMTTDWADRARANRPAGLDPGRFRDALDLFAELSRPAPSDVLLATDLHAGNVLRARREPWLVIDPKPFVGDPAYDATQHLLNCRARLRADPHGLIARFAELLEVSRERVRSWTFARAVLGFHGTFAYVATALEKS